MTTHIKMVSLNWGLILSSALWFACTAEQPVEPTPFESTDDTESASGGSARTRVIQPGVSGQNEETATGGTTLVDGAGGLTVGLPAVEEFTIVAVPDTQFFLANYKGGVPEMFGSQFQWIADNLEAHNIQFVTHLGDIVEQYPNGYGTDVQSSEWDVATAAFDLIHGKVPYGMTPGNHDCDNWQEAADDWGNYNRNFPAARFEGMPWYGGNLDNNENSYQLFSVSGMDFIVIHLRWEPTSEARSWASQVLSTHADRRAIVVSHEIENAGFLSGPGPAIWDEVVKGHDNVFMMLSGHHCARESTSTLTNDFGHPVYSLLSDYQCDDPQPAYLRLYKFKPLENNIEVKTYSPWTDSFETDENSEFTLPYAMTP